MENYSETIKNFILKNKKPSYLTTNKKELRVRCPYCGDSKSNKSSAHLYIEMNAPFRFHCFKCETSGVLNQQVFRDLGLYDVSLSESVIRANNEKRANSGVQYISFKKHNIKNLVYNTERTTAALSYLNNRFNTSFTAEYVTDKFKCVLDPLEFFKENRVQIPQIEFDYSHSIGFISTDSSHIIFRDYGGMQQKRYNNLNIFNNENSIVSKTYNISGKISVMEPKIKLVITEGIFDIIGVYNHFYKGNEEENVIFAAACGKAYNAVILNYIRQGFLDLEIEIYSDADVEYNFYKNLKLSNPYLKNSKITVYYNSLYDPKTKFGKDYGTPKEQIKLKKIII